MRIEHLKLGVVAVFFFLLSKAESGGLMHLRILSMIMEAYHICFTLTTI